jgi:hypothetical protein
MAADDLESRNALEAAACRFHEHQTQDPLSHLADLVHPEAEMTLLINHLQPLRGRQAITAALERGREADYHRAHIEHREWLDDAVLFLAGQARYAHPDGGISNSRVWWLDEFRDGLLWRVNAFMTEDAVRSAYEAREPTAVV